ncbi:SDR family oxidoreductase [Streptomyces sp. A7024]|uniref:SDR family oxidoreductase n=1 Tax=Streptomyces coryli TaxID=1128680 RepID=A0A6G4U9F6_9ACTN|nr:SDR family oxidoreductase [Streptomyces coryli]NGN68326.1 SDR family oxidoreductase [Streptomyces coryli]
MEQAETILVTGATGTLGRPLVERLVAADAPVRVLSRRPRPAGDERPYAWAVGDLKQGTGLDAAVAGAGVIVHCATDARNDTAATRRLLAAAKRAGSPHFVYISIVGVDRVPLPYYRSKLAIERLVEDSGLPWTVLRTTQFHDLAAKVTDVQRRLPFVLVPGGLRIQPIEVTEVAERLAELARGPAVGRVADMGGPQVLGARETAAAVLRAAGRRRPLLPVRLPGRIYRAFREGGHLAPEHAVGKVSFAEYLAARRT